MRPELSPEGIGGREQQLLGFALVVRVLRRVARERPLLLTLDDLARAERARGRLYLRAAEFFQTYDLLVTPATIVAPFDVDIKAIDEVDGPKRKAYCWSLHSPA